MAAPQDSEDGTAVSRLAISGHQVDVGDTLHDHVTTQVGDMASKYFGGAEEVAVTFSRTGKGGFGCTIRVHAGRGLHFDGEGDHADAYAAFNQALERVAKQLRRRKRELREDKPTNPMKDGLL